MGTNDNSILTDTKRVLGVAEDVTIFDPDILMHLNSALGRLNQLGIGPEGGFEVTDVTAIWADLLLTDLQYAPAKSYIHLYVKRLFDPPQNSWLSTAMREDLEKYEWTLNVVREDKIPIEDSTLPDEDEEFLLDGGII